MINFTLSWAYALQSDMIENPFLANTLAIIGILILVIIGYLTHRNYKRKRKL